MWNPQIEEFRRKFDSYLPKEFPFHSAVKRLLNFNCLNCHQSTYGFIEIFSKKVLHFLSIFKFIVLKFYQLLTQPVNVKAGKDIFLPI